MTKRGLAWSVAAYSLLVAGTASAQPQYTSQSDSPTWLKDRRYSEGIGVRAGDLEVHPGIAGEFGYDSNWFQRSNQQGVDNGPKIAPVIPALELRVTPSLYLSTVGLQRRQDEGGPAESPEIAFRAGVNATYRAYFGVTSDASQPNNDIAGQANVGGAADARLDILPGRPVGGAIFATFGRTILPNEGNSDPDVSFNQDAIGAGVELGFIPGGGTLDWHVGYQFSTTLFETNAAQSFTNYTNEAYLHGHWRFRPQTALLYDASFGFFNYSKPDLARAQGLVSSTPVRARLGLNGLVTDRFAVLAMLGWGASFFDDKIPKVQQFDSLLAQVELKWFLAASPGIARLTDLGLALSAISVGFTRDFQNSYLGNYDTLDRGYIKFDYMFAGRVAVSLAGGVGSVEYPTLYWLTTPNAGLTAVYRGPAFTDVVADASVFGEYRFTDTFGMNATFRYSETFSKTTVGDIPGVLFDTPAPAMGTVRGQYGMAWQRFEAYLGVRLFL